MSAAAKAGILIGVLAIIGAMAALAMWAYRADYQVLFSDVAVRDAGAMTAELDRLKVPYQLTDGGATILVPKDLVYKTRLKLMSKDLPLHGAVGFEVFNNADFGMTEFVQKVNYLRAIQGELTRTIQSIDGIQAARVHLAIPEQGLFKKALTKPKASVTITTKAGHVLGADQIAGIQRLVAASVADIVSGDVTVLDQHGVALTRVAQADGGETSVTQLDAKRSTEDYLVKKVTDVLDRTFGAGTTVASVDVVLNLDQSKVTTEEVLPGRRGDAAPSGVLVRERLSSREGNTASPANAVASAKNNAGVVSTEADYQVGRRVEQLVVASGTVRRMTVAVLVKQPLSEMQIDKLKQVVASSLGLNPQRGDSVVVSSFNEFYQPSLGAVAASGDAATLASATAALHADTRSARSGPARGVNLFWVAGVVLVGIALLALLLGSRRRSVVVAAPRLSPAERARLLQDVRQWIATPGHDQGGPL
jgi:flagellar M-ring protein FliF